MKKPLKDRVQTDGTISLFYDDHLALPGVNAAILQQSVTSRKADTQSPDDSVLLLTEENILIAVGTGTAILVVDGIRYPVTVKPAPISLFMITGNSLGEGAKGESAACVVCEDGQTYSTYKKIAKPEGVDVVGLGAGAAARPENIDAFAPAGKGTPGEGSGLAYRWNELTGEKIWIVNAAVGGSCLNEWVQGSQFYSNAVALYRQAAQILASEVAAGHYVLKDTGVIYHSGANFFFKKVIYDNELLKTWYHSMWYGFKQDLAMDLDGDGEAETVNTLGLVIARAVTNKDNYFITDFCANYYMAGSDLYPDVFMTSHGAQPWTTDEGVQRTFPDIQYQTHGTEVEKPQTVQEIYADNIHLRQVAYNAIGMNIADNLYRKLRTDNKAEALRLLDSDHQEIEDKLCVQGKNTEFQIALLPEPYCVSDLTIGLSEDLELSYPFVLKAKGNGTLTVSQGDTVLKSVAVEVCESF